MKQLDVLSSSVDRLAALVASLPADRCTEPAYPSEWSIAQVMSHLGSGAVIFRRTIEATAAGTPLPEGFDQQVWDEWNAKSPGEQVAEALTADRALLTTMHGLSADQVARLRFPLGPSRFDLAEYAGMRLNEHALHTWDIAVVDDPEATVLAAAVPLVLDGLQRVTQRAGRSDGIPASVSVHTCDPDRDFTVITGVDAIELAPAHRTDPAQVVLPAEAFVRLVYGRLDPEHTPAGVGGETLDRLRRLFPGF